MSRTRPPAPLALVSLLLAVLGALTALSMWPGTAAVAASSTNAAGAAVSVFPSPGVKYALPGTQIVFRGLPASAIGQIAVTGSRTGPHSGQIAADSDGDGGSFIPNQPFQPGEKVTVATSLNVLGAKNGSYQFTIGDVEGPIKNPNVAHVSPGAHGLQHFRSAPTLVPAALSVTTRHAPGRPGDIFLAPQYGPSQDGPMILDSSGNLIWFDPVPNGELATDFRVQHLGREPVLTWWQGHMNHGSGRGEDMIFNSHYQQVATVKAGDGLQGSDLHEFLLTSNGDAYITAVQPLHSSITHKPLMDSIVQEIDVKTGLVLFEWDALDHIPLSDSSVKTTQANSYVYDPYHVNSISLQSDGNLIVSMRNTSAVYELDHHTGKIIWTLGGKHSSFKLGSGVSTAYQHAAEWQGGQTLVIFDDGAGPPAVHKQSRAIKVALDTKKMTARLVKEYDHKPPLLTNYEGNAQTLPGGDLFVGWGQLPDFTEFTSSGSIDFDAHFNSNTDSYRAYRFPWSGQPTTLPALALSRHGATATVYASWNGATGVSAWRILGGTSPTTLKAIGTFRKRGFETTISVHSSAANFTVEAMAPKNHVLATATPIH